MEVVAATFVCGGIFVTLPKKQSRMNTKAWIEAMRLRTLPVSVAGIVATLGYNFLNDNVNRTPVVICLAFALLCQVASNFANEYFDYTAGRDRRGRTGPRRGVTEGDISPAAMRKAIYVTLGVACCLGLSLVAWGGWWLLAVGALVAVGVFAYSTGPYPLSTNGWGEVAVVFFFGIIPVTMTYYVETLQWDWQVAAGGLAIGLLGANVLIVNNYRDVEDDRRVDKRTLAVRWGRPAMLVLYCLDAVVAGCLMLPAWLAIGSLWWIAPVVLALAAFAIAGRMSRLEGAALTPLLGMTAMLMCLYSLVFAVAA